MSLACVLVINCGSSSMKFSVIPQDADQMCIRDSAEAYVTHHRHPFVLQTPEEAFHWAVIPAVSAPAHTLRDLVSAA